MRRSIGLSDNPVQAAGNWTVAKLYDVINGLANRAKSEKATMDAHTHAIAALYRKAGEIPEANGRAAALAEVGKLSRRQAQLILDYRSFTARWVAAMATVSKWIKSVGLTPPSFALSGLGTPLAPLVPIAIIAAVGALAAYIATLVSNNVAIARAIDQHSKAYNDYMDGKLTFDQYQQVATNINAAEAAAAGAAGANLPQNSLDKLLNQLVPIGLIVLAIVIAPTLLQTFAPRRAVA